MPAGQGQIITSLSGWTGAGAPFGGTGAAKEMKLGTQTYLEYGLWEGGTAIGQIGGQYYRLSSPTKDSFAGLDYSGVGLRQRLWANDAWVFSLEAGAEISGATRRSAPAQAGNTGPQAGLMAMLGHSFSLGDKPAFVDLDLGYRARTQGPPGEWRADLTLGADFAANIQIIAQSFNTLSNGAGAPGFSAWEQHVEQLSLVYALDEKWKLQVGGFTSLYHRKTNSEYGALVALWRRF